MDALRPVPRAGDLTLVMQPQLQTPTNAYFAALEQSFRESLNTIRQDISHLAGNLMPQSSTGEFICVPVKHSHSLVLTAVPYTHLSSSVLTTHHNSTESMHVNSALPATTFYPISSSHWATAIVPMENPPFFATPRSRAIVPVPVPTPTPHPHPAPTWPTCPSSAAHHRTTSSSSCMSTLTAASETPSIAEIYSPNTVRHHDRPRHGRQESAVANLPTPDLCAVSIPLRRSDGRPGKRADGFRDLMQVWDEGLPDRNIPPMKAWLPEWTRSAANRKSFAQQYSNRKIVAEEFIITYV